MLGQRALWITESFNLKMFEKHTFWVLQLIIIPAETARRIVNEAGKDLSCVIKLVGGTEIAKELGVISAVTAVEDEMKMEPRDAVLSKLDGDRYAFVTCIAAGEIETEMRKVKILRANT